MEANDAVEKKEEEKKKAEEKKNAQLYCLQLANVFHDFPSKKTLRRQALGCGQKKMCPCSWKRIVILDSGTQHKHFDVNLKERRG